MVDMYGGYYEGGGENYYEGSMGGAYSSWTSTPPPSGWQGPGPSPTSGAAKKRKRGQSGSGVGPFAAVVPQLVQPGGTDNVAKQELNIWLSRHGHPAAKYDIVQDPAYPGRFQAVLLLPTGIKVSGSSRNRKDAEKECAVNAMRQLQLEPGSLVCSGRLGQVGKAKPPPTSGAPAITAGPGWGAAPPAAGGYAHQAKYNAESGFWVERRPAEAVTELITKLEAELGTQPEYWVFTHDELMWEFPSRMGSQGSEGTKGHLVGHVRDMCLWDNECFGKASQYGLKCGLREGQGDCTGVAFRVTMEDLAKAIEIAAPTTGVVPTVKKAELAEVGEVSIICFVADQSSNQFAISLTTEDKGNAVAGACGTTGPNIQLVHLLEHELRMQGVVDEAITSVCAAATRFLWGANAR